ncbi:hypothetical protein BBJ28_00023658, partial [Nothophytophthora sp. Chile5]
MSAMDVDVAGIRAAFAACNLEVAEDALSTCVSLCAELGLSSDDLAAQWDAYSMNNQITGAADTDGLVGFRSHLVRQKSRTKEDASTSSGASQKRRHGKVSGTPVIKRVSESQDKLEALYNM